MHKSIFAPLPATKALPYSLPAYMFAHWVTDFSSIFFVFLVLARSDFDSAPQMATLALVYNALAFGLPSLIGGYYDQRGGLNPALLGLTMLIGAYVLFPLLPAPWRLPLIFPIGLGNALFHVGGGLDSLCYAGKKALRGGLFAAPGALGVGAALYLALPLWPWSTAAPLWLLMLPLPLLCLALLALLIFSHRHYQAMSLVFQNTTENSPKPQQDFAEAERVVLLHSASVAEALWRLWKKPAALLLAYGLFNLAVFSADALLAPETWRFLLPERSLLLFFAWLMPLLVCAGRIGGAYCFDRFDKRKLQRIFQLSLSLSCILGLVGSPAYRSLALALSIFLLSALTSPLTLMLSNCHEQGPGLSFGLTKLALLTSLLFWAFPPLRFQAPLVAGLACIALLMTLPLIDCQYDKILYSKKVSPKHTAS